MQLVQQQNTVETPSIKNLKIESGDSFNPEIVVVNGIRIYGFPDKVTLINYATGKNKLLVAVNAEKIYNADQELKDVINQNIGYPDGVGAVWALKKKGIANVTKIPGVELWLEIVNQHHKDKKFYFIGAREEIIQGTIDKLKKEFPGVQVAGFRNGYLKEGEQEAVIKDLIDKKPDFVFVAMGSPTQERLMIAMSDQYPAVYLGLGGSFDIYSGKTKRAPEIFIRYKLEWLYRLLAEPKRAARQIKLIDFAWKMLNKQY
jgi:UDP-N-acetyl-D-mannosaminouronate:lipid I N-acetyl-D-mannosaminouronosyltransferase